MKNSTAGKYMLRLTSDSNVTSGWLETNVENSPFQGYINSPTVNGYLLVRVEAKNAGSDLDYVKKVLDASSLTSINQHYPVVPPLTKDIFTGDFESTVTRALEFTARLSKQHPPIVASNTYHATSELAKAGLHDNIYTPDLSVNPTLANTTYQTSLQVFSKGPTTQVPLNNNWTVLNATSAGSFNDGTNYLAQPLVTSFAGLQNTANQAIYPQ